LVVNGVAPPANSALASAGAELYMNANWSLGRSSMAHSLLARRLTLADNVQNLSHFQD
jgi:hypothetical protein